MDIVLHLETLTCVTLDRSSNLEEVLKVGMVVRFALQQGGGVELAGAETDVRLHVRQLRRQQVPDHLDRHVLTSCLFTHAQSSGMRGIYIILIYYCKHDTVFYPLE